MESIYLTKWGSYVDLSKIVSITRLTEDPEHDFEILFDRGSILIVDLRLFSEYIENDAEDIDSMYDHLVDGWKQFKGEKLQGIYIPQPDLQPRL